MTIGNLSSHSVLLGILGFFIITVLSSRHFHAAVLISIVVTSCCGLFSGDVHFSGIYSVPPSISGVMGEVDLSGSLSLNLAGIIFSFMLINLFDSSGTLIGVTDKAGLIGSDGKFPGMRRALYVDSVSSVAGAFIGTSSVTAYIESTSGVAVGAAYRPDGGGGWCALPAGDVLFSAGEYGSRVCNGRRADLCRCADDLQPFPR